MKVKINSNEFYNLELPEVMETTQFIKLVDRLEQIKKTMTRDIELTKEFTKEGYSSNTTNDKPRIRKKREHTLKKPLYNKDRNEALRVIKIQYQGSQEDKQKLLEEYKVQHKGWSWFSKSLWGARTRFNIKPEEVGISKFASRPRQGHKGISQETKQ